MREFWTQFGLNLATVTVTVAVIGAVAVTIGWLQAFVGVVAYSALVAGSAFISRK